MSTDFERAYIDRWVSTSNNNRRWTEESLYKDSLEKMTTAYNLWAPTGDSYRTTASAQHIADRIIDVYAHEFDATTYALRRFKNQDNRQFQESYPKGDIDDLLGIGGAVDV